MVRLILYNIEYLEGISGEKMAYLKFWRRLIPPKDIDKKISNQLKKYKPDIVSLVEIGGDYITTRENHINYFKKSLGLKHQVSKVKYKFLGFLNLLRIFPLFKKQSNAILSKNKISHYETKYFKEGIKKTVILADIKVPKKITLILIHLALGKKTREKQLGELIEIVKHIKNPLIVTGDFNTFKGEKEVKKLLEETNLKHRFNLGGGRKYTYPSFHPRRRFDYILTSPEIKVKKYEVLKSELSDHLPVLLDFSV